MKKTTPLYYEDAYRTEFDATVLAAEKSKKGYEVLLDRTCFYPEGGGQPADRGTIGGARVLHVSKDKDGTIVHLTDGDPGAGAVSCAIDWEHRYEYMQQHTGQHILSGALYREGLETVSVHQGSDVTTIEVEGAPVTEALLLRVEKAANEAVRRDLEVRDFEVAEADIGNYPLRRPPKVSGSIRLVEIDGWDLVACGGVHTARTAEIGLIKAVRVEKIRGNERIYFKIGRRAYDDYRLKSEVTNALIDELSAQPPEITERVRKLIQDTKDSEYRRRHLEDAYASLWIDHRVRLNGGAASDEAAPVEPAILVETLPEITEVTLLQTIAQEASKLPAVGLLLFQGDGEEYRWALVITGTEHFPQEALREELLPAIGAKGGGKPPLWQGKAEAPDAPALAEPIFRKIFEAVRRS